MSITVLLIIAAAVTFFLTRSKSKSRPPAVPSTPAGWVIGPIIRGTNHSIGMPASPTPLGVGWFIDFPGPGGKVDYVQNFSPPALQAGKTLKIDFTVSGAGFVPFEFPDRQAMVSVQFQRRGDNWSGTGAMQSYRWYSRQMVLLAPGEFTLTVPLVLESWGDVQGKSDNPDAFAAAMLDLDNIAIVFGHSSGAGHGVYATEPSRFTLLGMALAAGG